MHVPRLRYDEYRFHAEGSYGLLSYLLAKVCFCAFFLLAKRTNTTILLLFAMDRFWSVAGQLSARGRDLSSGSENVGKSQSVVPHAALIGQC